MYYIFQLSICHLLNFIFSSAALQILKRLTHAAESASTKGQKGLTIAFISSAKRQRTLAYGKYNWPLTRAGRGPPPLCTGWTWNRSPWRESIPHLAPTPKTQQLPLKLSHNELLLLTEASLSFASIFTHFNFIIDMWSICLNDD